MRHTMRKTRGFWAAALMLGALLIVLGIAGSGNVATAAKPQTPRFVDNGDGTITDTQTGLMWEKKTGTVGGGKNFDDPTNVDNTYTWTANSPAADGTLFADFLAKMNCTISATGGCGPGNHRDWRIPTIAELRTILTADPNCSLFISPCIDPIFGPTAAVGYWSSSSLAGDPGDAWLVNFGNSIVAAVPGTNSIWARAVRGGS